MIYLTNRDGGLTDEEGHYKYLGAAFTGNVISGMSVGQNSPLGMSVVVSGGDARIPYGSYAYAAWIPSGSPEIATIPTADGSNPRIDRIVLYVDRSEATQQVTPNNPGIAKIAVVPGTPGAIPVRPSDSDVNSAVSNNPWINLADVRVNTGVTQITNANITDTRVMAGPVIPNGFIGTAAIGQGAVTSQKLAEAYVRGRLQTDANNSIANSQPTGITEQFGWGQRIGVAATVMSETVTFPVAFTTLYSLQVTFLGATGADSIPAVSMVDFEMTGVSAATEVNNPTLSGFTVILTQSSNFNTSRYYGFSWTAKGII